MKFNNKAYLLKSKLSKYKSLALAVADTADTAMRLYQKPNIFTGVQLAAKVFAAAMNNRQNGYDFFQADQWTWLQHPTILYTELLKSCTILHTCGENHRATVVFVEGELVGFLQNGGGEYINSIFALNNRVQETESALSRAFWKVLCGNKGRQVQLQYSKDEAKIMGSSRRNQTSKRSYVEYSKIKRYVDAGIHRSLLIFGPPGTGKTTLADDILNQFDFTSLKIRSSDINVIGISLISQIVDIMKPDAIILDDFDQVENQASCLELLELFHQECKLVLGTINNVKVFNKAILRPGRFDEFLEVKEADPELLAKLLTPALQSYAGRVKTWPAAFINEFALQARFREDYEVLLQELQSRVDANEEATKEEKAG